ncbi:hypothetical protein EJD97_000311 [Solanum chilense]|uniref:Uncharacterized protein n=1 Tax=Solanum chilense TaxID=4083 RepID=A0A6N2CF71_SOLCI|nr:hypothetical protein EJD97_000311 [Solanum chilense]
MTMGSVSHIDEAKKDLVKDVHRLARLGVRFEDSPNGVFMFYHNSYLLRGDGVLSYQGRLCVPKEDELMNQILGEAYGPRYSFHPGTTKMYHDLTESQKSYADHRRRDLKFEEGDKVYLKISPMKGVVRFGKKGKLSPRYFFHVSMLKKCIGDPKSILTIEGLGVKYNISYEEVPVEILFRQVKKLWKKEVASLKVLWKNHLVEGTTWRPRLT